MINCETCKHSAMGHSLSGHHLSCRINANQPVYPKTDCEFFNENGTPSIIRSGLEAYEKKHEFFAEEEFRV